MCRECVEDPRRACLDVARVASDACALRLVLVAALDRESAARAMDGDEDAALARWPSSLYTLLAITAMRSPLVWRRCEQLVDRALGETSRAFDRAAPAELLALLSEGCEMLTGRELAALLWSLLRRSSAAGQPLVERLAAEVEIIAARRLGGAAEVPRAAPRARLS